MKFDAIISIKLYITTSLSNDIDTIMTDLDDLSIAFNSTVYDVDDDIAVSVTDEGRTTWGNHRLHYAFYEGQTLIATNNGNSEIYVNGYNASGTKLFGPRVSVGASKTIIIPAGISFVSIYSNSFPISVNIKLDTIISDIQSDVNAKVDEKLLYGINLIGNDVSVYYPVDFDKTTKLTMSTSDGSVFSSEVRINYYDADKQYLGFNGFLPNITERTVTVAFDGVKFIKLNSQPPVPIMLNLGTTALPYEKYYNRYALTGVVDDLSGEVTALTGVVVFPPTFEIDLSDYNSVKIYGTDVFYTYSTKYSRRAIQLANVPNTIAEASWDAVNTVLTINMPGESILLLDPIANTFTLQKNNWQIPAGKEVLLYRYYSSYGGFLFDTSFTRRFKNRVEEVLATHNPRIIDKYAEQIGNVVSGADYSRGSYNKNLTFLLVSDSHEDYEAIGNAIELSENINAIDCILHLGDSAAIPAIPISGLNPVASYIAGKTLTKPFFAVMGNHDGQNNGDSSTYGTVEQGVAGFLATLNTSSMYDERGYGYYDFTDKSIRLIILNCFDYPATTTEGTYDFYDDYILWQQDQVDFFINTLKSVPSGYTVIVASHYSESANIDNTIIPQHSGSGKITGTYMVIGDKTRMSDVVMSDIINAYKQRTTLNKSYTYSNGSVTGNVSVNDSFTTANGEFAIWVCGHKHRSSVSKSSVGDYWVYVHDTSCCGQSGWATAYSNQPRCRDTNTRDLITAMSIDTSNKVINFTRIGAHINRFLDDENLIHLSYATEST